MSNQNTAVEKVNTKEVKFYMTSGKVIRYNLTYDKLKEVKDAMVEGKNVIIIGTRIINVCHIVYVDMI